MGVENMSIVIRAHFDGKVIVPEEPVDLPVNESFEAELRVSEPKPDTMSEKDAAWEWLLAKRVSGVNIPEEALRRENMYEDRL